LGRLQRGQSPLDLGVVDWFRYAAVFRDLVLQQLPSSLGLVPCVALACSQVSEPAHKPFKLAP
jgi:hypothetical protein